MGADESLARGLTDRFFSEVTALWGEARASMARRPMQQYTRLAKWRGAVKKCEKSLSSILLRSYLEDRKQHSFWFASVLIADEMAQMQDWEERCLKFRSLYWPCNKGGWRTTDLHVAEISAHAVQRLFQRTDVGYTLTDEFQRQRLIKALRELPDWITCFLHVLPRLPEGQMMYPVIPTSYGMFLAELRVREGRRSISVRTFVGTKQLTNIQARVHAAMREAFQWVGDAPYFVYQESNVPLLDALTGMAHLWLFRMRECWPEFAEVLASPRAGTADRELEQQLVRQLDELWVRYGPSMTEVLNQAASPVAFEDYYERYRLAAKAASKSQ